VADFNIPHLRFAPPSGVGDPVIFGTRKLEFLFYRVCGVICVILHLAVLMEYRSVLEKQTDRQTCDDGIYRASIASRVKNVNDFEQRTV